MDVVRSLPAPDSSTAKTINAELLTFGRAGILQICEAIHPPSTAVDVEARLALSGLAVYVSGPGLESVRKQYAVSIIEALEREEETEVKAFLIGLLQFAGKDESVPAVGRFLTHERLCEPAALALVAIGTPAAESEFLRALPRAQAYCRITAIKALGDLRSVQSAEKMMEFTTSEDSETRLTALYAVANAGYLPAVDVLAEAAEAESAYERRMATSYYLLLARRLGELGSREISSDICRKLIKNRQSPEETHIRSAALSTLVAVLQENALNDLLLAMESDNKQYRLAALELGATIPGEAATGEWVGKLKSSPPHVRAEIVTMLGRRGDHSAWPAVLSSLEDESKAVRLAAIPAAAHLGKADALPPLLALLERTEDDEEIGEVKEVLLRFPVSQFLFDMVITLPRLSPPALVSMLDVLTVRRARVPMELLYALTRDPDESVRLAAIEALGYLAPYHFLPELIGVFLHTQTDTERLAAQKALASVARKIPQPRKQADHILRRLRTSSGEDKRFLLGTLAHIGGDKALGAVLRETENPDSTIRDMAIRSLAQWRDVGAVERLMEIARTEQDLTYHVLALRGVVRIAQAAPDLSGEEKIEIYKSVLATASRPEEKKLALAGSGKVSSVESLRLVSAFLRDDSVKTEAAMAALRILSPAEPGEESRRNSRAPISFMGGLLDSTSLATIRSLLNLQPEPGKPPEGFTSWFNGRNLRGWTRCTNTDTSVSSTVETGALLLAGGGDPVCTEQSFGDFELLVDWKIQPGGRGSVLLRGVTEVEICDPDICPEGSGALSIGEPGSRKRVPVADRPVGEWNTFRIVMIGERITVYLNEVPVVVDAAYEDTTGPDNRVPSTGPVGLHARTGSVLFRNIFLKEIARPRELFSGNLFNGSDLTGWQQIGGKTGSWKTEDGILFTKGGGGGWLSTTAEYSNFLLELDFKLPPEGNSGVFLRAPHEGDPAYTGMEIQILDDYADKYAHLKAWQYTGSIYGVKAPSETASRKNGEWQHMAVLCSGPRIAVTLNGERVVDASLVDHMDKERTHPGLKRRKGYIGLQNHNTRVEYKNIRITELE